MLRLCQTVSNERHQFQVVIGRRRSRRVKARIRIKVLLAQIDIDRDLVNIVVHQRGLVSSIRPLAVIVVSCNFLRRCFRRIVIIVFVVAAVVVVVTNIDRSGFCWIGILGQWRRWLKRWWLQQVIGWRRRVRIILILARLIESRCCTIHGIIDGRVHGCTSGGVGRWCFGRG